MSARVIGDEKSAVAENLRARSRLVRQAALLGVSLVLLASLCLVVASHVGFEDMACKMAEDILSAALNHSRSLVRGLQDSVARRDRDVAGALREDADWLRSQLVALVENDPTVLYGMFLSKEGDILVHTRKALEGTRIDPEGEVSSLSTLAREFPRGRLGYDEFVYEVRTPLEIDGDSGHMLLLGLSKAQIDRHIGEVRRGVRLRMLLSAGIGFVVLIGPGVGLWAVLRQYRRLGRKAHSLALMAQVGQMANGLAHEIRNPLNAIRFNLKIMEEDIDHFPQEVRGGYAQIIRRASREINRLADLLTEYLSYARPGRREPEPCDLNAITESVLRFVEYECQRYDIEVERELSPGLPKILVEERRLKQAVLNLVLNAQQALRPTGGTIQARSYQHDGVVVLEIADDGPGVPEDQRQRIFEPFHSTRAGGTGLGLAIARRVAEEHDGTIECRSSLDHGAAFILTLPLKRSTFARKQ